LTPTVTATLVNAIPAFRIAKNPTLTHKPFSINNKCKAGFLPFGIMAHSKIINSQTFQDTLSNLSEKEDEVRRAQWMLVVLIILSRKLTITSLDLAFL
jgi:hypothetical protein